MTASEAELARIKAAAHAKGLSLSNWLRKLAKLPLLAMGRPREMKKLTKQQRQEIKSLVEDIGYTRAEAIAIVLSGGS